MSAGDFMQTLKIRRIVIPFANASSDATDQNRLEAAGVILLHLQQMRQA